MTIGQKPKMPQPLYRKIIRKVKRRHGRGYRTIIRKVSVKEPKGTRTQKGISRVEILIVMTIISLLAIVVYQNIKLPQEEGQAFILEEKPKNSELPE